MMLALGMFVFMRQTLPHQTMQRDAEYRWPSNSRVGKRDSFQYLGPRILPHGSKVVFIKRHSRPEEVATMVAGLAGPKASFVTGAMQTIDGAFGA